MHVYMHPVHHLLCSIVSPPLHPHPTRLVDEDNTSCPTFSAHLLICTYVFIGGNYTPRRYSSARQDTE